MFDKLFEYPGVVARHREAPFSSERASYLTQRAADGTAPATLCRLARELLVIVHELDLSPPILSIDAIQSAAERWARSQIRRRRAHKKQWSRSLFIQVAQDWLRFLGRLQEPKAKTVWFISFIEKFSICLRHERGLSDATVRNYVWYAERFLGWLDERGSSLAVVSVIDVDAFVGQCSAKWSRVSCASCAKSLRAFFRHAERHGWCSTGIAAAIESPRVFRQETLPTGPDWESVQKLIASANGECPRDIRDRAILLILSTYGFRSAEVARLELKDFDWERERIRVRRFKQRRHQEYPLIYSIGDAVLKYLKSARPKTNRREIFLSLRAPFRPLSAGGMYHVVSTRIAQLGIQSVRRGPHALRHACAGHLVAEGCSLKEIGDHLGHRSASSTRVYAKVDLAGLREVANFDMGGLS